MEVAAGRKRLNVRSAGVNGPWGNGPIIGCGGAGRVFDATQGLVVKERKECAVRFG